MTLLLVSSLSPGIQERTLLLVSSLFSNPGEDSSPRLFFSSPGPRRGPFSSSLLLFSRILERTLLLVSSLLLRTGKRTLLLVSSLSFSGPGRKTLLLVFLLFL